MSNVVIDTSVFIDHLRGSSLHLVELQEKSITQGLNLLAPYMVIIELFAGEDASKKALRKQIEELLERFAVIGFTAVSAKLTGEFIRRYKQIPDPLDHMIAAIAIEQDAELATHNTKHFKQIRGLKLFAFNTATDEGE